MRSITYRMDAFVFTFLLTVFVSTTSYARAGKHPDALPEYYCSDSPCLNGGRCLPHDPISRNYTGHFPHPYDMPHVEHFTCQCTSHWTGTYCQIARGHPDALPEFHCSNTACLNGGTCHPVHDPISHDHPEHGAPHPYDKPHVDHFTCQCTGHWTGAHCEIALLEYYCAYTPCFNGGTCHPHDPIRHDPEHGAPHPYDKPHVDHFICQCTSHWTGVHCEHASGLQNVITNPNLGTHTDVHVGRCALNPCIIDGTCALPGHHPDHMYTCQCQNVHTALECNTATGICLHYDCHNGGQCTSDQDRVYCHGCANHWYGDDCGTADICRHLSCMHGDCIENNHGARCHCRSGWTGFDCSTALQIVPTNPPHGYHTDVHVGRCDANPCVIVNTCTQYSINHTCQCINETTSRECNAVTGYCTYYHCYNGGHCTSDNDRVICQGCHDPWHGGDCGTANSCDQLSCIHGVCLAFNVHNTHIARCICAGTGYTGYKCHIDIDECSVNTTCQNGGTCVNSPGHFNCHCPNGWTDIHCHTDVNECAHMNPCLHGGNCTNTPGHYTCRCEAGWTGDQCQTDVDECSLSNPCQNGGNCTNTQGNYTCRCDAGWTGDYCQTDVNECAHMRTCRHGGNCTNTIGHFTCRCNSGWTGDHCQTDVNECAHNNPCQHGGNCTNTLGHFTCRCDAGWTGDHCQTDIDECSANTICQNGGHCVNSPGHFNCHCANGWTDTYCQTDINECSVYTTCLNGGTCVNLPGHFNCHCANGWTDIQCQTDINECSLTTICQNGGRCSRLHGYSRCICANGWTGAHCQTDVDECSPSNPCQNSGNCTNTPGHYTCICNKGWRGEHCQTDMVPKCNHTCFLDAVFLSKSVFNGTTDCSGTSTLASNEALPEVCCSMRAHADWQHGEQVQTNGACIDGKIPPSTPIAAVNGTHLSNAGIFYSCITNGSPGFTMIRQDCTTLPQLMHVDSTSDPKPDNYYVIY